MIVRPSGEFVVSPDSSGLECHDLNTGRAEISDLG